MAETDYKSAVELLTRSGCEPEAIRRAVRIANRSWDDLRKAQAALEEHLVRHGCGSMRRPNGGAG